MKPRGILIAGNWKMNHGPRETAAFFQELRTNWTSALTSGTRDLLSAGKLEAALAVPAVSLAQAVLETRDLPIKILSQNTHWEKTGAFTGEISGPMLQELGVSGSLVGHSERRQYFGETDETVKKRTESLLSQDLNSLTCIGETRQERETGQTTAILHRQLDGAFPNRDQGASAYLGKDRKLVIAYEPVWAIGTGLTATPEQAEEAHQGVRKHLWDRFGMEAAGRTLLLYGGSVTPENVTSLLACPNIDGALVGGASLKPISFLKLLEAGGKACT